MKYQLCIIVSILVNVSCQWILVDKLPYSPCYKFKCSFGQRCAVVNNHPICKCNHNCAKSHLTGPVCTTTGRTFKNLCELKKEECKRGIYMLVDHYGNCTKTVKCHDSPREKSLGLCADWNSNNACVNHRDFMLRFCPKTCKFCDQPEVSACKFSRHGCCRGTDIPALGPKNKGCFKGCRDGRLCPLFPNFCGDDVNKKTMRKYCPFTCRYCVPEGNNRIEMLTEDDL